MFFSVNTFRVFFRFAARTAFLMFFRAAERCFSLAMDKKEIFCDFAACGIGNDFDLYM